jgi:release factor glutamine methyltransferase
MRGLKQLKYSIFLIIFFSVLVIIFNYKNIFYKKPTTETIHRKLSGISDYTYDIHIKYLDEKITILKGVFTPYEAEVLVLPLMNRNPNLFLEKKVLEIGTGSGVIALYASKLRAKKVIATDISLAAINNVELNAKKLGFSSIIEARHVSKDNIGAYSVIKNTEKFDIIIANPPYSLDLDVEKNTAVTDSGDLGFSIINGLQKHLKQNGKAILLYNSFFYHHIIIKYAKHRGFHVTHNNATTMTPWEVDSIFNLYSKKICKKEGIDMNALHFNSLKNPIGSVRIYDKNQDYLFHNDHNIYPGMIVIEHKTE